MAKRFLTVNKIHTQQFAVLFRTIGKFYYKIKSFLPKSKIIC